MALTFYLSVRLSRCVCSVLYIPIAAAPGRIMAVRPTSEHLDFEAAISRAADSLGYILKSEQEQCLKSL